MHQIKLKKTGQTCFEWKATWTYLNASLAHRGAWTCSLWCCVIFTVRFKLYILVLSLSLFSTPPLHAVSSLRFLSNFTKTSAGIHIHSNKPSLRMSWNSFSSKAQFSLWSLCLPACCKLQTWKHSFDRSETSWAADRRAFSPCFFVEGKT